jgi:hypothetical protein
VKRRTKLFQDQKWLDYVAKSRANIVSQENKLLMPAPFSPVGGVRPAKL